MATTDFVGGVTLTDAAWFDDVDCSAYSVLSSVAGTNTITATGPATYSYAATRPPVWFIPAVTNTGATTINVTASGGSALGAKNIFHNGAACVGGELVALVPAALIYDGTQYHIVGNGIRRGLVQRAYAEYTANSDLTTTTPGDDTIPQNTEGTEILTAAITPKSASNRIRIRFQGSGAAGGIEIMTAALFVDTTANALAASNNTSEAAGLQRPLVLEYEESAASTSARTYKIRVGGSTTTMRLNGTNVARRYGGVARCTLIVEEIS